MRDDLSGPIPLNDQLVRGLKSVLFYCFGRSESRYIQFKSWLVRRFADIGLYESTIFSELLQIKFEAGAVAVDVGANCGVYSKLFLKLMGKEGTVHAFEPNSIYSQTLMELSSSRGARLKLYSVGVSDHEGTAYLQVPTVGAEVPEPALARIVKKSTGDSHPVPLTTLDKKLADLNRLDLLKVDVEGGECAVLRGAANLLRKYRPILVIEAHDRAAIAQTLREIGVAYTGTQAGRPVTLDKMSPAPQATYILRPQN